MNITYNHTCMITLILDKLYCEIISSSFRQKVPLIFKVGHLHHQGMGIDAPANYIEHCRLHAYGEGIMLDN